MRAILAVLCLSAAALGAEPTGVIVQFNGKKAGDANADTKDKAFKPVFEKDLAGIAAKLPGKPALKLTSWYTIINGGAISWGKVDKGVVEKLKAELEKLPYVKTVELDIPTPPPGR